MIVLDPAISGNLAWDGWRLMPAVPSPFNTRPDDSRLLFVETILRWTKVVPRVGADAHTGKIVKAVGVDVLNNWWWGVEYIHTVKASAAEIDNCLDWLKLQGITAEFIPDADCADSGRGDLRLTAIDVLPPHLNRRPDAYLAAARNGKSDAAQALFVKVLRDLGV
jgi:hypothetical protein